MSWVLGDNLINHVSCESKFDMLKNPHCSKAMNAEHRFYFAVLHRQWRFLHELNQFRKRWKTSDKQHIIHPFYSSHSTKVYFYFFYDYIVNDVRIFKLFVSLSVKEAYDYICSSIDRTIRSICGITACFFSINSLKITTWSCKLICGNLIYMWHTLY